MEQAQLAAIYARHREIVLDLYHDALLEMHPSILIRRKVKLNGTVLQIGTIEFTLARNERVYVIGFGKASGNIALALESVLENTIEDGIVLVPRGFIKKGKRVQFFETDHPMPTNASWAATLELIEFIKTIPDHSIVINLISGGTSSLLFKPPSELEITSIQELNQLLLDSGATISEINTVRKQVSEVHGGRLLPYLKNVRLVDIILSDVPGNNPADIGSGPTTVDDSTIHDALTILEKYNLIKRIPAEIADYFYNQLKSGQSTKPQMGSDSLLHHWQTLLGTSSDLAAIISEKANEKGYSSSYSDLAYSDSTRTIAIDISRKAIGTLSGKSPLKKPALLVFHGESYVHVTGSGKGGRNQELALTAAISIEGQDKITLLSIGTDGKDGPTDAAGAIVNGLTTLRARKKNLEPEQFLRNNDSYSFFKETGDLIYTQKHFTNLMDIQIALIDL